MSNILIILKDQYSNVLLMELQLEKKKLNKAKDTLAAGTLKFINVYS